MKIFIKRLLREQMIDGQNMNKEMQYACNKMTINSYSEALENVERALKGVSPETRTRVMQKIHAPLENLKNEESKITDEIKTSHMSGDSIPDEADTYWSQIQTTLCELGSDFQ